MATLVRRTGAREASIAVLYLHEREEFVRAADFLMGKLRDEEAHALRAAAIKWWEAMTDEERRALIEV